jgi:uncharacterized protein (TIGR02145 family)
MKTTTGWQSPNTAATNQSGFSGLPGGLRFTSGAYLNIGFNGNWWSSTENATPNAWNRYLDYSDGSSYRVNFIKQNGFSVRCLKD